MAQPQDAFAAWLDAFAQENDLLLSEEDQLVPPGQYQGQFVPDAQVLISQLQQVPAPTELLPELDMVAMMDFVDAEPQLLPSTAGAALQQLEQQEGNSYGGGSSSSKQASGSSSKLFNKKLRPKNTKRYKSQAQKDAHKRYRERKKQNITTMEQEVAEKQELLQQLQAENAALQSKMRVLETSLNCSTQIHGLMQLIDGVDRLGISSSSPDNSGMSGSSGSSSISSRSSSGAAAAAAAAGLVSPGTPGMGASLLRSSGSTGSGSSTGLDAAGSSSSLLDRPLPWDQQALLPGQPSAAEAQQLPEACPLQQQHAAEVASGSSSLQAIAADAQQQHQRQQALALEASGVAGGNGAAAAAATAAAAAAVDTGPLSGCVSSPEQGVVLYKEFLRKAQALMVQRSSADPAIAAAADARLDALTRSAISEVFQPFLVAKGQGVVYDMNKRSLETLQPAEPPESLWAAVLQAMELNQQQRQDALACYRRFGACLSRLVDQRLALNAQYKALQQAEEAADRVSKVLLRAHSLEVLQAISKSLAAYSSLDGVFAHTVTSIISGSQMAVACVSSYPWLPQWHTIMAALQQQDEAAAAAAADAAQARQGAKKPTRRGRPPRSTQLMGMQHTVRA